MKLYFTVIACFIAYGLLQAQPASIMGNITAKGNPVNGAVIAVNNKTAFSDVNGNYKITDLKKGSYILTVKHGGFIPINKEIAIEKVENIYNIELKEDALSLEQVVVSSNRNEINKYQSAVIVNTIGKKLFQSTLPRSDCKVFPVRTRRSSSTPGRSSPLSTVSMDWSRFRHRSLIALRLFEGEAHPCMVPELSPVRSTLSRDVRRQLVSAER